MGRNERGMVTAELAIASFLIVAVAAGMVGIFGLLMVQLRCVDAAAEIARQAARGDAVAAQRVEGALPPSAQVVIGRVGGGLVQVTVTAPVRPIPRLGVTVNVMGRAAAALEPGVP